MQKPDLADPRGVGGPTTVFAAGGAAAAGAAQRTDQQGPDQQRPDQQGPDQQRPDQQRSAAEQPTLSGSDLFGGGTPPAAEEPTGEPPEERSDPAVARLVAGLQDDVIVIDEQPRYHVPGCRSLAGQPPIPLPAAEAIELGFTPCGWCQPNRSLASRHPANAR